MNKFKLTQLIFTLLFISSVSLISQPFFEGKVKFKITHEDDVNYLDYFMKNKNLRMEMGDNAEAVFIKNSDKSLVLMPEEEMYMDLDNSLFSKLPGMSGVNEDVKQESEEFDIEKYKTGKVKSILGYECHQWIFTDENEDGEVEAWVTSELGNFMLMQSPMGAGYSPGWSSSVKNNGFFPMLVITREDGGDETSRFEATEINKQNLNDDLFKPPSNYSEMKIPGMDSFFK